jgi:hypothetical protein
MSVSSSSKDCVGAEKRFQIVLYVQSVVLSVSKLWLGCCMQVRGAFGCIHINPSSFICVYNEHVIGGHVYMVYKGLLTALMYK